LKLTPPEQEALARVNEVMAEQRALGLGSQGGNYPVPVVLDPTVNLVSDGQVNPLRQIARVETITGNKWAGVNSTGIAASYDAEFEEVGDDSPTLTQPSLDVEKAQAFVPISIEAFDDWSSAQTELARMLADAKDALEADKFLKGLGHGSHEPQGLLVGATAYINTAATASFAIDDLYALTEALPERWQPRASLIANRATFNRVRRFDTAGGADLWVTLGNATPARLLDYGTYAYSAMSGSTASGSTILTVGDFSQFLIAERAGLQVEVLPMLYGTAFNRPIGARGIYAWFRNSSVVLSPKAFKSLVVR
jgi:HK97 family phage major capsid protein